MEAGTPFELDLPTVCVYGQAHCRYGLLTLCVWWVSTRDVTSRGADMLKVCRQLQPVVEYMNVGGQCVQKYNCEGHPVGMRLFSPVLKVRMRKGCYDNGLAMECLKAVNHVWT